MYARPILISTFALVTLIASGCGGGDLPAISEYELSADDSAFYQDAVEGGASAEQLRLVAQILEDGGAVALEVVQEATARTFACFNDNGIEYTSSIEWSDGVPVEAYRFSGVPGLEPEDSLAVADACIDANSFYVEALYQTQPAVRANLSRKYEIMRPLVEACLVDHGVPVPADLTNDEVITLGLDNGLDEGYDCIHDADVAAQQQLRLEAE